MNYSLNYFVVFALLISFSQKVQSQFSIDYPDAVSTYVTGINDAGHICGYYTDEDGYTNAFFRLEDEFFTFNYENHDTWFGGINNEKTIVGRYNPTGDPGDFRVIMFDTETTIAWEIPGFEGFQYVNPHDINDNMAISGDLLDSQRRFFYWSELEGLNTQNVIIGGSTVPTYGGYGLNDDDELTGWYIDGVQQISFVYDALIEAYVEEVDLPDPLSSITHKTNLKGNNENGLAIADFALSDQSHFYNFDDETFYIENEKVIPNALEVHIDDINNSNYSVGYFVDENGIAHGYADLNISSGYDMFEHGHTFANSDDPLWNWDFDAQADLYQADPYWGFFGEEVDFPLLGIDATHASSTHPSWVDYVEAMSAPSCYFNVDIEGNVFDFPLLIPSAYYSWNWVSSEEFGGSCFGMCANSNASWQYPVDMNEKYGGNLEGLYALGDADYVLNAANKSMAAQGSQTFMSTNQYSEYFPHQIMSALVQSINSNGEIEVPVIGYSAIVNGESIAHAVYPYAFELEGINSYRIYIYDPNEPGNDEAHIAVDYYSYGSEMFISYGGQWSDPIYSGIELHNTLEIFEPQLVPYVSVTNDVLAEHGTTDEDFERVGENRLFCSDTDSFSIDGGGGSLVVDGTQLVNTIDGARPWTTYGGVPKVMDQFIVPDGTYTLTANEEGNNYFSAGMISEDVSIIYNRYGTANGETDVIELSGNELSYVNELGIAAEIRAEVIAQIGNIEYYFDITSINLDPAQNISLEYQEEGLFISNDGSSTDYDVMVKIFDQDNGYFQTEVQNIPIGEGITQIIIPDFGDDGLDGIIIDEDGEETDYSNEGLPTIALSSDTLFLTNDAQLASFAVGNMGSGLLNWEVIENPTWLSLSSATAGVNYGVVDLDVTENSTDSREGNVIVQNSDNPELTSTLVVIQGDFVDAIGEEESQLSLEVFPNPTPQILKVSIPDLLIGKNATYEVTSMNGELIESGVCNDKVLILDFALFADGVYVLKIMTDTLELNEKFVKVQHK